MEKDSRKGKGAGCRVAPTVEGAPPDRLTGEISQLQSENAVKYLNLRNVISVIQT